MLMLIKKVPEHAGLTGWGKWYLFELGIGVVAPLVIFSIAIHHKRADFVRLGAFITVFGIVLNRLNTALITFNWQLYQEIPHVFEVLISITIFAIYIAVYRFILNRLPILFAWREAPALATQEAEERHPSSGEVSGVPVGAYRSMD